MIENRKFIRLRTALPVQYSLVKKHKAQRMVASLMKNISVGGLSLIVKEPVRNGDLVQIQIQAPHLEEPLRVVGDVVWHSPMKEGDGGECYEAGIRFQEVNPDDLNRILDYVYSVAIG